MKLEKGKKAGTRQGMRHNVETMLKAGYSPKRARGAAYGEVGMEKKARRDESKGMKKAMHEKREDKAHKDVMKHLMKDNKEMRAELKEHKKLINQLKKSK